MHRFVFARAACLCAFAFAFAARANSVTDEVGVGTTDTTPDNPRAGNLSNNLDASFDLSDRWTLNAGVGLFREAATPRATGSDFGGSASGIAAFSAGLEFDPTDAVALALDAEVSPSSTQTSASQLTFTNPKDNSTVVANDQLRAASSSSSIAGSVSYDSTGDSDLEWGLNFGLTGNHFATDQRIVAVQTSSGPQSSAYLKDICKNGGKCSRRVLAALRESPATLDSARVSVGGTITAYTDTDFSLTADYYGYDQDPTQVGYFSIGARQTVSGGGGIAIAPLRYLLRPEVVHRFGDFSAKLWVTTGEYVDQTGQATRSIGTRLQYKFTKAFRLWLSLSVQNDTDQTGGSITSGNYGLGAGYRF